MKFKPGQSGNPAGKPKGAKDKRTALRELLLPHAADLVKKAVDMALAGDATALRICIDRLIPAAKAKDSPITLDGLSGSLGEQGQTVVNALAGGQLTPDEANAVMSVLSAQARIIEVDELEKRLAALEERTNGNQHPIAH
ncbi:Uncharacterised protein [Ralstonia pickettii]|uniref:DUF5681 domain-containing protein n=1 Tax=Ralstonia pickettii TaxID=329 RepID=UPI000500C374|nr:DUF5681 domain-containing protein [Ralstonia pickettii]KFL18976.1 hypothetical protein DP23_4467 [Ralstonia pickettii]QQK36975.1 hypothetical protein RP6297_03213 [Ralstonia pickettii]UCA15817.1 DUF5681 domain-containing protein [Ralstonia pickettii]SUE01065.1 Uncharacterised protein [Ralstonia pickettii]